MRGHARFAKLQGHERFDNDELSEISSCSYAHMRAAKPSSCVQSARELRPLKQPDFSLFFCRSVAVLVVERVLFRRNSWRDAEHIVLAANAALNSCGMRITLCAIFTVCSTSRFLSQKSERE